MLPKQNRATTRQVQSTITKGTSKHSKNFSIRFITKESPTTVAVVISKKVEPTAVGRNSLKRRIRNVIRSLPLIDQKVFTVYVKKGACELSIPEIKKELESLLT